MRAVEDLVLADRGTGRRGAGQFEFPQQFARELVEAIELAYCGDESEVAIGHRRLTRSVAWTQLCRPDPSPRFVVECGDGPAGGLHHHDVLVDDHVSDDVPAGVEPGLSPPHANQPVAAEHGVSGQNLASDALLRRCGGRGQCAQ